MDAQELPGPLPVKSPCFPVFSPVNRTNGKSLSEKNKIFKYVKLDTPKKTHDPAINREARPLKRQQLTWTLPQLPFRHLSVELRPTSS